eukprot:363511-Chlamydomonas_euryale.AAC.3
MRRLEHPSKAFFSNTPPWPNILRSASRKARPCHFLVHPPATHMAPPRALMNAGNSLRLTP